MTQVFISFKNSDNGKQTRDSVMAKTLHQLLKLQKIDVFMSNSTLSEVGDSNFKEVIDNALEQSLILILVGTREDYILSPWVKYEWNNFYQDIMSDRKKGGEIYCVFENYQGNIPIALRYKETFSMDNESLNSLVRFVSAKLNIDINRNVYVCSRCGKVFTPIDIDGCRYHPLAPILKKEKNFDGSVIEKYVYPCCGKVVLTNGALSTGGCMFGKHKS